MNRTVSLSIILTLVASSALADEGFSGAVSRVTDGDAFVLSDNTHVRLWGIDAPAYEQICNSPDGSPYPCGRRAEQALEGMISGRLVQCEARREDHSQKRRVAVCFVEGVDLSSFMVGSGYAVDNTRYSSGRYLSDQTRARIQGRGIWSGRFELPKGWRSNQRNG